MPPVPAAPKVSGKAQFADAGPATQPVPKQPWDDDPDSPF
jgi:hypothetical protein